MDYKEFARIMLEAINEAINGIPVTREDAALALLLLAGSGLRDAGYEEHLDLLQPIYDAVRGVDSETSEGEIH
jgi:hypothetical protein